MKYHTINPLVWNTFLEMKIKYPHQTASTKDKRLNLFAFFIYVATTTFTPGPNNLDKYQIVEELLDQQCASC